jgi:mycofactocin system FadH/OYE family oxidoreductase 2
MNAKLEQLFAPLKLGPKTAPNRLVFASHLTNFGFDNVFTERHADYYAERARGGAGVIVLEEMSVHPSDWPFPRTIFGYRESCVDGLRQVREAVRVANPQTLVLVQLNHYGGQGTDNLTQREILAPSAVQDIISRQVPKAMEIEDIRAIVEGFSKAAGFAKQAGLDGVEINVADRSLVRQFLSGLTNFRGDEYGGSFENKLRFAQEVIGAVRKAVGPDLVVGIKLCGDELAPWAGLTPEQAQEVGKALAQSGQLDYISVMMGSIYSLDKAWASMHTPPGFASHLAAGMRKALSEAGLTLPVIASGRLQDPVLAADLLAEESADLVEMTRALISDPELPLKVQQDRLAEIRYCTACNQDCQVRSTMNPLLTCVHNAAAGEEARYSDNLIGQAGTSRKVFVIGGGPGGMEAARVAALRGHSVTLIEKAEKLGGALNLAALGPGRNNWLLTINYLKSQVERLDVEVRCSTVATPELIEAEQPDAVIVATGGRSVPLYQVPVDIDANVLWARQAIAEPDNPKIGPNIVIIDEVGSHAAASVAEMFAGRGHKVTLVTHDPFISRELTATLDLNDWYRRALPMGIVFMPQKYTRAIEARAVVLEDIHSHAEERLEDVDTVILANYEYPNDELYHALKALPNRGFELYRLGDSVAARKVGHAIREANKIARKL